MLKLFQLLTKASYYVCSAFLCRIPYEHVVDFSKFVLLICAGVSKYLRHSETVSAKHYDFGAIEQCARNRICVDKATDNTTVAVTELETDSNSTISQVWQFILCKDMLGKQVSDYFVKNICQLFILYTFLSCSCQ